MPEINRTMILLAIHQEPRGRRGGDTNSNINVPTPPPPRLASVGELLLIYLLDLDWQQNFEFCEPQRVPTRSCVQVCCAMSAGLHLGRKPVILCNLILFVGRLFYSPLFNRHRRGHRQTGTNPKMTKCLMERCERRKWTLKAHSGKTNTHTCCAPATFSN